MTMSEREQMEILSILYQMEAEIEALQGVHQERVQEIHSRITQMEKMLDADKRLTARKRANGEA